MSPIQTATREQGGPVRAYPPPDLPFAAPLMDDTWREIVVDWQLPSEVENRRS